MKKALLSQFSTALCSFKTDFMQISQIPIYLSSIIMKNLDCWPFLVSRNRSFDYRTIVAPDFLCEKGDASILANTAGGDLTGEDEAFYREIHKSKAGELTLVFRVIETTLEAMGIEGSGFLKDSFGREIRLIEGIVLRGLRPEVTVTKNDLEMAHEKVISPYREFWECTRAEPAKPSECFSLPQDGSESCLQYQKQQPYGIEIVKPQKTQIVEEDRERQGRVSPAPDRHRQISKSQQWISSSSNQFTAEVTSVIFLPKGDSIAIRYESNQTIIIRDFSTRSQITFDNEPIIGILNSPTPIAISPNGEYLATAVIKLKLEKFGDQNVVKLWKIRAGKKSEREINGHRPMSVGRVLAVAFTPDSEMLLSGGKDQTIFFWDVQSGGQWGNPINLNREIRAIAVSPNRDMPMFAIGNDQGIIELWNWDNRHQITSFTAHPRNSSINSLAFSPDGRILVSGGDDCIVNIWYVHSNERLKSGQHEAKVRTVAFSPDGKLIASGDDSGIIKIWDVETMENVILPKHHGAVTSLAFSPDGKTLASGSKDKTVRLWERE
jgi:WD40 repeat protein